jgi:hypothetical protein
MTSNAAAKKTDAEIQRDVVNELAWDTRVSSTQIGVQVKNGVVTLIGILDDWMRVRAAQEAAHRVRGVLDVANDLDVKLASGTGKTAVRRALEWGRLRPRSTDSNNGFSGSRDAGRIDSRLVPTPRR